MNWGPDFFQVERAKGRALIHVQHDIEAINEPELHPIDTKTKIAIAIGFLAGLEYLLSQTSSQECIRTLEGIVRCINP